MHVVNARASINDAELTPESTVADGEEVDASLQRLALEIRIGVSHGDAVKVDDGDVVDGGRIADDGLQQRLQSGIRLQAIGDEFLRVIRSGWKQLVGGVTGVAQGIAGEEVDLVGDEVAVLISLGHSLLEHLGNVDVRKKGNQGQHQSTDGEHELGL